MEKPRTLINLLLGDEQTEVERRGGVGRENRGLLIHPSVCNAPDKRDGGAYKSLLASGAVRSEREREEANRVHLRRSQKKGAEGVALGCSW